MKVGDLIKLLQEYPSDLRVVVDGYETGYDDLTPQQISAEKICLNTGENDWKGKYGNSLHIIGGASKGAQIVDAVILHRTSH